MNLETVKADTQRVYTRKAEFWHRRRNRTGYENNWLDRFAKHLPKASQILDLACGTGDPIAAYFLARGHSVTGVDYAPTMIEIARKIYPDCKWCVADITELPDFGQFDGILSWDGFFHLSMAQQRAALPEYAKRLKPGGSILLTVGTEAGEVTGKIDDETVYHASLSAAEYTKILKQAGFAEVTYQAEDPNCLGRSLLFAKGLRPPT